MALLPTLVKIVLLGLVPFAAFVLSETGLAPYLVGVVLACFTAGNFLGAMVYRGVEEQQLGRSLFWNASLLMGLQAVLVLTLKAHPSPALLGILLAAVGVLCARYSIQIRAIRQIVVPRQEMPMMVSGMGFLVRLATPLGAVLWGYIFARTTGIPVVAGVSAFTLGLGIFAAFLFKRAFDCREERRER